MIGFTPEEAIKRLNEQGAAFEIKRAAPRKRVLGKAEPRVMRVRERSGPSGETIFELLVGEFRVFDGDRLVQNEEVHI